MRITWHSNAPWAPSGYGQQTALTVPRLQALGYDISVSAFYGLQGAVLDWNGIRVYPSYRDPFGNDVLPEYAGKDWVVALMDIERLTAKLPRVACWTPVDHDPLSPGTAEALKRLHALPIAMSRFGEAKLTEAGFEPRYIPHAIDTNVFVRYGGAKEAIGVPEDAFVVGIVAANRLTTFRKGIPEMFEAFARFTKAHSDAVLLVHAEENDYLGGAHLGHLAASLGIEVRFRDQRGVRLGLTPDEMALAYSAMDVLLNCSYGEGFGIPIVEAQACGTPVIATNFSAMPELIQAGWLVDGEPFFDHQKSWFRKPLIGGIVDALEEAYDRADDMRDLARFYARRYDIDYVVEDYWKPVLAEMEAALDDPVDRPRRVRSELAEARS